MTRIGLLSDTHAYLDPSIIDAFASCDEIWHAGDFGSIEVFESLRRTGKIFRHVYGNIDSQQIRIHSVETNQWRTEDMNILMTHIGGYPGKYPATIRKMISEVKPDLFICGHSHILRIMYDKSSDHLHLNPGACGREGFHKVRTVLRFTIDQKKVEAMEVIELGQKH